jgi:hypothetical protein
MSGTSANSSTSDRGIEVQVDPSENRIALVIGNSAYHHVGTLRNPVNDAVLMAKTAKTLGFELIGGQAHLDLDRPGMEEAISKLGERVKGTDGRLVTLFYYAGHAIQVEGENWLAPVTAQLQSEEDVDFQMVKVETVLKRLSNRPDSVNIVVLDACRNNPFPAGRRSGSRGLAGLSRSPEGTLIAYSTAPGSTADDGDGNNSVYTAALAKAMKREGLDLYRIFMETRREVRAKTKGRQITWDQSSLTDTFYLIPPREPEPAPLPPPAPAVVQVQPQPRPPAPAPAPPRVNPPDKVRPTGCWLDRATGLCWQEEPSTDRLNWASAAAYCKTLDLGGYRPGSWRLPTISELRSLIHGCPNTEKGGRCGVTDSCSGAGCWNDSCRGCTYLKGPGRGGAYWPAGLSGPVSWYWSSSSYAGGSSNAWYVDFDDGYVYYVGKSYTYYVRCVRGGP